MKTDRTKRKVMEAGSTYNQNKKRETEKIVDDSNKENGKKGKTLEEIKRSSSDI